MAGTVCIDFDGVIHPSGGDPGLIPDMSMPPTPGVEGFMSTLQARGYRLVVLSSRATVREGAIGIKTYLRRYNLTSYISDVTGTKIPAIAYIDNRAVRYRAGNWQQCIIETIGLQHDGG